MGKWYVYEVLWKSGVPPFPKNLRVANARLQRADYDAPVLTTDGFIDRWRNPLLTAKNVFRILYESNANVGLVQRHECPCDCWNDCNTNLTKCGYRRAYRGENEDDDRCNWYDENGAKFYQHNQPTRILKSNGNKTNPTRPYVGSVLISPKLS